MYRLCYVFLVMFGACTAEKNLVQLATDLGATTVVTLLRRAGLEGALSAPGQFTLFAPTNAAFEALPTSVMDALSADKDLLKSVLMFHASDTRAYSGDLSNNLMVNTLNVPLKIRVNIYDVNSTQVVTVDGAKVVKVDQNATNGVIHVIDKVMYPLPSENLFSVVTAQKGFGTLVYALVQSELAGALSGPGPFTLFAPNNEAFNKLPAGALSDLLSNQTALIEVLKYHVVPAIAYSAGLSTGPVPSLQGKDVNIVVSDAGVTVNGAKVFMADLPATNGVVHEIDEVLLPPSN